MPAKINMFLINANYVSPQFKSPINVSNLSTSPSISSKSAPTALNAPILARVHNVRPGCGSCGRH